MKMLRIGAAAGVAGLAAAPAVAAEAGYTVVPAAERLTLGGVFGDAAPEVQLVMAILILTALGSIAVWALALSKLRKGDAPALAAALGRLKIVRSAGVLLGALAASYVLLQGFIGLANVRPTPSVGVMASGWAEAALMVLLGVLATTVAVVCERHLEARVRRAAAA